MLYPPTNYQHCTYKVYQFTVCVVNNYCDAAKYFISVQSKINKYNLTFDNKLKEQPCPNGMNYTITVNP